MNARGLVLAGLTYRNDVGRFDLDAIQLEELADEVMDRLVHSADVAVVEDVPDGEDEALLVFSGAIACPAWPLGPLAANGAPTVPVWTALYDEGTRRHLVAFDTEDMPGWKRALLQALSRGLERDQDRAMAKGPQR